MNDPNVTAAPEPKVAHGGERPRAGRPAAPKSGAVKQVIDALGLTHENLAREIGCTLSAVRLMLRENRLPSKPEVLEKFEAVARRAGVSIEVES